MPWVNETICNCTGASPASPLPAAGSASRTHVGRAPVFLPYVGMTLAPCDGCVSIPAGFNYAFPKDGKCREGAPLGTDGCTWRLIEEKKYANATCVDEKADAAVELHGKTCFDQCPHPLNRNTDCYLDCYRNTLMGDASQNITRVPPEAMIKPWVAAFTSDDPAAGGCPPVTPTVGPFGAPVSRPF